MIGLIAGGITLLGLIAVVQATHPASTLMTMRERIGRVIGLRVDHVVVEGRANTPEPLLHAALGVSPGDPMFGFSVEQARARIETLSWVKHVAVERRLPGTVVVSLQEKRPFAIWQYQGRFQLIDRNGEVVTNEDVGQFGSLPLVVGLGAPPKAVALLDLLAQHPAVQAKVAAAVRVGDRRWNLKMTNGADVLLPEGAAAAAIAKLAELQASDALLDRPLAMIDLRLPDRLAVRPQPEVLAEPHAGARPETHTQSQIPAALAGRRAT